MELMGEDVEVGGTELRCPREHSLGSGNGFSRNKSIHTYEL